jgi:hypothetical protein
MFNALVSQFAHVNLQGEKREDHEAKDREGHYLGELLETVQQGVDDSL